MKTFKIFADKLDGSQMQVELTVSSATDYLNFIENYEGNDLGNDIIFEDFVVDTKATGVIIEN